MNRIPVFYIFFCILAVCSVLIIVMRWKRYVKYSNGSIGNDNGDRELIIKAEKGAVLCGFLDAAEIGSSEPEEWFNFKSWVENGCEMDEEDDTEYGNVYITKLPDEKLKFLAETKKIFALSISTGVLYQQVNTLPCVIVQQITESKADILIQKTSYPECYKFGK